MFLQKSMKPCSVCSFEEDGLTISSPPYFLMKLPNLPHVQIYILLRVVNQIWKRMDKVLIFQGISKCQIT